MSPWATRPRTDDFPTASIQPETPSSVLRRVRSATADQRGGGPDRTRDPNPHRLSETLDAANPVEVAVEGGDRLRALLLHHDNRYRIREGERAIVVEEHGDRPGAPLRDGEFDGAVVDDDVVGLLGRLPPEDRAHARHGFRQHEFRREQVLALEPRREALCVSMPSVFAVRDRDEVGRVYEDHRIPRWTRFLTSTASAGAAPMAARSRSRLRFRKRTTRPCGPSSHSA